MSDSLRKMLIFVLVGVGAFVLAFGLGQVAGDKKDAPSSSGHEAHEGHQDEDGHDEAPGRYAVHLVGGKVLQREEPLRFQVVDPTGKVVTAFDTVHEKKLHLIVVDKDDLTYYRHLHPVMAADGTWSAADALRDGSEYRAYADATPSGATGQVLTADFSVGDFSDLRQAAYEPNDTASVDGYDVALKTDGSAYTFTVTRDGKPVALQPYLGAGGHLVGIREKSLDYLHAHAMAAEDNTVGFHVEAEEPGTWVLHLDFQVDGKVHDATFVQQIDAAGGHETHDMGDMEGHEHDH